MNEVADPHHGQQVLRAGVDLSQAKVALIMLHGRGADAADIIGLSEVIDRADVIYLAPEAAGHIWYPNTFMAPVESNEPGRTSALNVIANLIARLGEARIAPDKIAILGFSQGASLALEFAARKPRRYGGIFALSGGLMGEAVAARDYSGSLDGTPVFIGCSDIDPHIPLERVRESASIMGKLGAQVTEQIYPGLGHIIVEDEIVKIRGILDSFVETAPG